MREAKAVIGKNFGDEGKGRMVDSLCRGKNALVVRHNGGAQAGHTVETENFRFVFHQLGSGSLQGCPAFWSRTFLPDLLKLGEEAEDFNVCSPMSGIPVIYADPYCACTTVYDVILNSLTERLRGKDKHGSCGMGIFETVLRSREERYALRLHEFAGGDENKIAKKLRIIRDHYVKGRLAVLEAEYPGQYKREENREWLDLIRDDNVMYNAAGIMCENFEKYVVTADWKSMAGAYDTVVFENGQGLMLDWDNEEYSPHLTASHTGLKNVAALLAEAGGARCLEVIYVTRTYVTRHGAGRLDHECAREDINPRMLDRTNTPNPWQDALRYAAHPEGEDFFCYIRKDLKELKENNFKECSFFVTLCLTHLDETRGQVLFSDRSRSFEEFCEYCREQAPDLFQEIRAFT